MTREEAIDVFVRFIEMKEGKNNGVVAPHDVFIDACKLAISALQDRPIGHWIDKADKIEAQFSRHDYKCDRCGCLAHSFVGGSEDWYDIDKPNYCHNCGAKMETQNIV